MINSVEFGTVSPDVAARVGTVREVITRVLFRLQTLGLIVVKGKDILILDLASLTDYAHSENG